MKCRVLSTSFAGGMASYANFQRLHLMPFLDERVERFTPGEISVSHVWEGEYVDYVVPDRKTVA